MNRTVFLYRLKPRSPFHFGERGVGIEATEDILHSDTIFSAICCALVETQGLEFLEEFLQMFKENNPPFLFSSAFPYVRNVLLFPKPFLRPRLVEAPEKMIKKYKNIRFLSLKIWEAMIKGENITPHLKEENLLCDDTLWVTDSEKEEMLKGGSKDKFWSKDIVPRVTIDRMTSASAIYHAGRITFAPESGLYFLTQFRNDSFRPWLENSLKYLADSGLGGERSCGHGQFELLEPQPFSLPEAKTQAFLTLSLYNPTKQDLATGLLNNPASYQIVERRGWIYSQAYLGKYRQSLRMFVEGSVLCGSPDKLYGCLANVTPKLETIPHFVYRYGFAFPVPVVTQGVKNDAFY